VVGAFADISNEIYLKEENKRLINALNILNDAVFYGRIDKYGNMKNVDHVNSAFSEITGLKSQQLIDNKNALRNIIYDNDIGIFDDLYKADDSSKENVCRIFHKETNNIVSLKIKTYLLDNVRYVIIKSITTVKF
jgi:hypothetical protein